MENSGRNRFLPLFFTADQASGALSVKVSTVRFS